MLQQIYKTLLESIFVVAFVRFTCFFPFKHVYLAVYMLYLCRSIENIASMLPIRIYDFGTINKNKQILQIYRIFGQTILFILGKLKMIFGKTKFTKSNPNSSYCDRMRSLNLNGNEISLKSL